LAFLPYDAPMKTSDYMEIQEGIADIMSALPELFDHPANAAAALASALAMHCRLWGITDDQAHALLAAALAEYRTLKH
jgi:hypothetical protein